MDTPRPPDAGTPDPVPVRNTRFPTPVEDGLRAAYGTPAYIRRARNLEAAEAALLARLERLWFELCRPVAADVKNFLSMFPDVSAAGAFIGDERASAAFGEVAAMMRGHPDYELIFVDGSLFAPSRAGRLRSIVAGVGAFNARWPTAVEGIDLDPINRQIDEFNRWYPLERECATKYAFKALDQFRPRGRITHADLAVKLPRLPEIG